MPPGRFRYTPPVINLGTTPLKAGLIKFSLLGTLDVYALKSCPA